MAGCRYVIHIAWELYVIKLHKGKFTKTEIAKTKTRKSGNLHPPSRRGRIICKQELFKGWGKKPALWYHKPGKPATQNPALFPHPKNNCAQLQNRGKTGKLLTISPKQLSPISNLTFPDEKLSSAEEKLSPQKPDTGPQKPGRGPQKPDTVPRKPGRCPPKPVTDPQKPDRCPPKPDTVPPKPDTVPPKPDTVPQKPDSRSQKVDTVAQKPDSRFQKVDTVAQKPVQTSAETWQRRAEKWQRRAET